MRLQLQPKIFMKQHHSNPLPAMTAHLSPPARGCAVITAAAVAVTAGCQVLQAVAAAAAVLRACI